MKPLNTAILLFHEVEVLDFAGPFEVFSRTRLTPGVESRRSSDSAPFSVFTVAKTLAPVMATGGLQIVPSHSFANCPDIDLLVIPGGWGTRALIDDEGTLDWIKSIAAKARQVTSVCTGSLLLAKAGILRGKPATTHWAALELLKSIDPTIAVHATERVVDSGIITSAGVSAGIDMALFVVARLFGPEVATDTARYMDYHGNWQASSKISEVAS